MTRLADRRLAVVGAGAAGLAAAHVLTRAGAAVEVLEEGSRAGGRLRTDELDGVRLDVHVQLFSNSDRTAARILTEAGGGDRLVDGPDHDALWREGRAHTIAYGSVTRMLTSGALPLRTKMALGARYLPFLTRHEKDLDLARLTDAAAAGMDGESIAEWGRREIGREFVELMADPQLSSFFAMHAGETAAGLYHAIARQGISLSLRAVRGGMAGWAETVRAGVERASGRFRFDTPVREIVPGPEGVLLRTDVSEERYDGVVVTAPAPGAAALLPTMPDRSRSWLEAVRIRRTVTVGIALDRPAGEKFFGLSFASGSTRAVSGVCLQERKGAALVPEGRGALVVYLLPAVGERLFGEAPDRVVEEILPDLRLAFPDIESRMSRIRVYRWPHGATLFPPGSLTHIARFGKDGIEWDPRVRFAGDYLRAPLTEGAVVSGVAAAERLASSDS